MGVHEKQMRRWWKMIVNKLINLIRFGLVHPEKSGCGYTNKEIRIVGGRPTGINVSIRSQLNTYYFIDRKKTSSCTFSNIHGSLVWFMMDISIAELHSFLPITFWQLLTVYAGKLKMKWSRKTVSFTLMFSQAVIFIPFRLKRTKIRVILGDHDQTITVCIWTW